MATLFNGLTPYEFQEYSYNLYCKSKKIAGNRKKRTFPKRRIFFDVHFENMWIFVRDVSKNTLTNKDRILHKKTAYQMRNLICGLHQSERIFQYLRPVNRSDS